MGFRGRLTIDDEYDTVVIGSGFGGTICAWVIANSFKRAGKPERVLVIERGGWWISPERAADKIRKFLEDHTGQDRQNWRPHYWPRPDNLAGLINLYTNFLVTKKNPQGLFDIRKFRDFWVIVGNGVGGGSLVYANVTVAPPDEVLDSWPAFYDGSNSSALRPEFDLARKFIGVSKIVSRQAGLGAWKDLGGFAGWTKKPGFYEPQNADWILDRTRIFRDASQRIQQTAPTFDFQFDYADLSIRELPADQLSIPTAPPGTTSPTLPAYCERQGRCVLGCLPGARNTLNKKLYLAMNPEVPGNELPIDLRPLRRVIDLWPADEGGRSGYVVRCENLESHGIETVKARRVILAAGTLGSTEILLNCKSRSLLPDLSRKLGTQFTINGDSFGFVQPTKERTNAARGPLTTSHLKVFTKGNRWEWKQPFGTKTVRFTCTIEDSGVPRMVATTIAGGLDFDRQVVTIRNTLRTSPLKALRLAVRAFLRFLGFKHTALFFHSARNAVLDPNELETEDESVSRTFFFACMGLDRSEGLMRSDDGRLTIDWPNLHADPIFDRIENSMRLLAEEIKDPMARNAFFPDPIRIFTGGKKGTRALPISVHPLGGCPIGRHAAEGVVNPFGQVFRGLEGLNHYENLYVADGSIVPSAIGVNPSLTISALAFKIAERIAGVTSETIESWLRQ